MFDTVTSNTKELIVKYQLYLLFVIAILIIGCSQEENEDLQKVNLAHYKIPVDAVVKNVVNTTGQYPAIKWMYLNSCYITTISRTYYGNYVTDTFSVPCN